MAEIQSQSNVRYDLNQMAEVLSHFGINMSVKELNKPTVTKVEILTSEGGTLQGYKKPFTVEFEVTMPDINFNYMALSFQILNHLEVPILYEYIFDINTTICRVKGINFLSFTFDNLSLYKGNYSVKVHLAETKTKTKFQEFNCCSFEVDMIGEKEPEWGWQKNVCQYFEKGDWNH